MRLIFPLAGKTNGQVNNSAHLGVWLRLPHDLLPQLANLARDDHGTIGIVWVAGINT